MAQKTFRSGRPLARLSITMFVHLNWDSCVSSHMWWGGLSPGGKNERVNEDVMILTQSALLAPYARNPLVANGLHSQMSGNDFCVFRSSKMLNKQASGRWFETSSCWCIEEDFFNHWLHRTLWKWQGKMTEMKKIYPTLHKACNYVSIVRITVKQY